MGMLFFMRISNISRIFLSNILVLVPGMGTGSCLFGGVLRISYVGVGSL